MSCGTNPVNILSLNFTIFKEVSFPKLDGTGPVSEFCAISNIFKLIRSPKLDGIVPIRRFLLSIKPSRYGMELNSGGIDPVNIL